MNRLRPFFGFLVFLATFTALPAKDVVVITNPNVPRGEKEAILILPGFGSKLHGSKHQKKYFRDKGYDLFIPKYISRKSIAASVKNVDEFIAKHQLGEYRKIHVFSYIVGSWTINAWIKDHPQNNIATIVYDRSPLQERAPFALVTDSPKIAKMLAGPIMAEFSRTPYSGIPKGKIHTGLLVESKATKLIRRHKKTALGMGEVRWDMAQFGQEHDDFLYTWLDHDDMYERFDVVGPDIFYFIKNGRFTDNARRMPYDGDPFVPFKEE